jgi:hypothetical protein
VTEICTTQLDIEGRKLVLGAMLTETYTRLPNCLHSDACYVGMMFRVNVQCRTGSSLSCDDTNVKADFGVAALRLVATGTVDYLGTVL